MHGVKSVKTILHNLTRFSFSAAIEPDGNQGKYRKAQNCKDQRNDQLKSEGGTDTPVILAAVELGGEDARTGVCAKQT